MANESIPDLIGSSVGEAAAFAAGLAIAPLLAPYLQELRNATWSGTPTMPLDPGDVAEWVAEDQSGRAGSGTAEAALTGLAATPFARLVETKLTAPGVGELLQLIRRKTITEAEFTHALRKARLETGYDDAVRELANVKLAPAQIALAVVRSLMHDPGFLPVTLDTSGGKVPAYGVSPLDTLAEASYSGIDAERLRVMVGEIGLPMSLQQAASAVFRGIILRPDFNRAVLEGDTRPEWADAIFEQARQILSANQYAELQLRGYIDRATRLDKTGQHGMSTADSDLLYNLLGRSIPVHQITTGLARGGVFGGSADAIPDSYLQSLQRGNLRPEYYNLAYANRYSLPSAFVIRALLTGGAITADQGEQLFLQSGWKPDLAKQVADFYGTGTTTPADPHIAKAQNQLWTTTHRSYIAEESDDTAARTALAAAGVDPASIDGVLVLWQAERDLIRKQLTPAQIKKAYTKAAVNVTTGAPWTQDEAIQELVQRGYSVTEAQNYLNIP